MLVEGSTEDVDLYVPVCSPVASYYDALAAPLLAPYCEVLHTDAETVRELDDKHEFVSMAAALGLSVPDSHLVTGPEQVAAFDFATASAPLRAGLSGRGAEPRAVGRPRRLRHTRSSLALPRRPQRRCDPGRRAAAAGRRRPTPLRPAHRRRRAADVLQAGYDLLSSAPRHDGHPLRRQHP
jgi:hypothetical protein